MTKGLVSIIVRTKNESFWIGKCLHEINNQIYKNYEIIVVDNKVRGVKVKDKFIGCNSVISNVLIH